MALTMTGKLGGNSAPTQKLRVTAQKMKTSGAIKPKKTTTTTQKNAGVLGAVSGGRSTGGSTQHTAANPPKPKTPGKLY